MVAYGTYERFKYQTVRMPVLVSWASMRLLLQVLGWVLLFAAGLAVGLWLFGAVYAVATTFLMTAGELVGGLAATAIFACMTYPR